MGDRALTIFTDKKRSEYSPVVYLHWAGHQQLERLMQLAEFMKGRNGDIRYAAARFIGLCHADNADDNLSLGVWNLEKPKAFDSMDDYIQSENFSHGDAGVFLVECDTWDVSAFNGYGFDPQDKLSSKHSHSLNMYRRDLPEEVVERLELS